MEANKSNFIHLHTHSHYSLLDGMSKIPDLVKKAKEYGMPALALTDHGNMYGAIEFYKECKKQDIKPIIGVEMYVATRSHTDKNPEYDKRRYHLTLLAKNQKGYKNLMHLVTIANTEGFYYKPRVDKELLEKYNEGIICLSGCPGSEFIQKLKNKKEKEAKELIEFYIKIYGKENVFIEIMRHNEVDWYDSLVTKIKSIAQEYDLPLVATWDSHYLSQDDKEAHEALLAVNTGSEVSQSAFSMKDGDYSFIDEEEANKIFNEEPEAITNTLKVAELVDLEIELGNLYFPDFKIESGKDADEELRDLAMAGFERRGINPDKTYLDRLEYELGIIKMKGYPSYFLVVADLIAFATKNGILTNIRGSVAGSLTTYLLGITLVDPIEYQIPFERFLNPERPSAPDIDMDFADNRRDEVLEYAKEKYGEDRVVQIGTFGTMMARGAVRDIARALGYSYTIGDRIAKMIPMGSQGFPMTIEKALELEPELDESYKTERDTRIIIDTALRIEGCARHISVHAAGVVISPKPLYEFTPVQLDPKGGKLITQYDMYSIEDAGLPKFDFLGIRNLAILADAIKLVEKIHGVKVDIQKIPRDDKKTFELLARGETEGLFQLNGSGMTKWLKELEPTTIYDINAMVALYRPGPMQFIPDYIARKRNPALIKYADPALEPILNKSYGVLVYQDDLLMMAHNLAGYSWGEVDKFRKAVGKKIPEEMAAQKEKFIKGCVEHSGWSMEKAKEIWAWIEPFAAYGFNKAHSASYGLVAYQTAYMKANYPTIYMASILTAESKDVDKIAEIIRECERMNIKVLPPNINQSFGGFTVVEDDNGNIKDSKTIRFGLYTIKNLGGDVADAIIEERKKGGVFKDIDDFLHRITHKNLNKKSLEALIKGGALDKIGDRSTLLGNLEEILEYNRLQSSTAHQDSLFGAMNVNTNGITLKESPTIPKKDLLAWEKELLGLYISGHPLEEFQEKIDNTKNNITKIKNMGIPQSTVILIGYVESLREVRTKNGDSMAFLNLVDKSGNIEATLFPKTFESKKSHVAQDTVVAIKAKIQNRNGDIGLLVDDIKILETTEK
ncbi:DNA polymerase III subunit alpha [Candidatus Nomurabacteria bacterium]|nr:DNA polymerase III subunit alpha [Candidatus Nomurabacteria bacterium]